MKNSWKSLHTLFWVLDGYGIQNDDVKITLNEFLTVSKTLHSRDIRKKKSPKNYNIHNIDNHNKKYYTRSINNNYNNTKNNNDNSNEKKQWKTTQNDWVVTTY